MNEWKEHKLGDVSSIQTGPFGSQLHKSDYKPTGIPCIMPCNISANLDICCDNIAYISEEDANRLCKHKTQTGDIIYSRRGDIEKCAYISEIESGWVCGTGCLKIRIDSKKANPKFIAYQLSTPLVKSWIVGSAVGTTMLNLNTSILADCPISLPSLPIQQKIANILSSLDDKIEVNRRINEQLEELAQALFNKMFFENNELERLPLSNFANINPTRTLSKGTEARYVEMANLPTKGSFPMDWSLKSYEGGMKFTNGDTIMARITPCLENGKTAYIDFLDENEVAFGSTEYIVISAKEDFCPALFYFLARNNEFVDYAVSHMNGSSGRQRVSGADIANFLMPNISTEDSNRFAEVAMPIMDVIRNNSLENRHLTTLRDTLLPKLMSGEMDVNERGIERN